MPHFISEDQIERVLGSSLNVGTGSTRSAASGFLAWMPEKKSLPILIP